uniref:hypothetical protein n=1 Tax=Salmonella enterica TaxID=28901 RepID=UPI00398C78B5
MNPRRKKENQESEGLFGGVKFKASGKSVLWGECGFLYIFMTSFPSHVFFSFVMSCYVGVGGGCRR